MDMPKSCYECRFSEPAYSGNRCDNMVGHTYGEILTDRVKNCPLKSADEMIAEIEETYINNCDFNYQTAIDIIHKYCDEE